MAVGGAIGYGAAQMKQPQPTEEPTPVVAPQSSQKSTPQQPTQVQQPKKEEKKSYHEMFHENLKKNFGNEYSIILNAAHRNGIGEQDYDNLSTLFAIRRAENGGHGKQFGVLSKGARAKQGESFDQSLDRQAGHAAYSLMRYQIGRAHV